MIKKSSHLAIATLLALSTATGLIASAAGPSQVDLAAYKDQYCALNPAETPLDDLRASAAQKGIKWDVGAGTNTFFSTKHGDYVITGVRFGMANSHKLSVGGTVDAGDATIAAGFTRERKEEWFGQLAPKNTSFAPGQPFVAGGVVADGAALKWDGWGPYLTSTAFESGYSLAELGSAVAMMNMNARLHFPLAAFFGNPRFSPNTVLERTSEKNIEMARAILKSFDDAIVASGLGAINPEARAVAGFVDLSDEVRSVLAEISDNGTGRMPAAVEAAGGYAKFGAAKEYQNTEYSEFRLMSVEDFKAAAASATSDLWGGEKAARDNSLAKYEAYKASQVTPME